MLKKETTERLQAAYDTYMTLADTSADVAETFQDCLAGTITEDDLWESLADKIHALKIMVYSLATAFDTMDKQINMQENEDVYDKTKLN